jgi:hypothetical protein
MEDTIKVLNVTIDLLIATWRFNNPDFYNAYNNARNAIIVSSKKGKDDTNNKTTNA